VELFINNRIKENRLIFMDSQAISIFLEEIAIIVEITVMVYTINFRLILIYGRPM